MKKCCMCKKELSEDCFKSNSKRKDGLQSQCIDCQKEYRREHYLKNKQKYIGKAKANKKEIVLWWREYKKQFCCCKCGESHPACLDFHHANDDKINNVSTLIRSASREIVMEEIAKCDVLCSNCHRKLHWEEEINAGVV